MLSAVNEEAKSKVGSWRKDEFAQREIASFWGCLILPAIALLTAFLLPGLLWSKRNANPRVVAYAAQDQVYAEPILRAFERETGIKVRTVYDNEAVKTVGLANRLLAEQSHPQCDVFWGNEEMRTRQLAARNVFRETNGWAAFGYRSRRIVINTNYVLLIAGSQAPTASGVDRGQTVAGRPEPPRSLLDLTNTLWRGKLALANPQFGTTATHFHALRQRWGDAAWQAWCHALAANKPFLVDGNSVVVSFVGRGEAWIGLSDSDDIAAGQREGLPVAALPLTDEMLLIPNTVAVVRGAQHPDAAQRLFEFLQRSEVTKKLVHANALEGASGDQCKAQTLKVDWSALLRDLGTTTAELNRIFLR